MDQACFARRLQLLAELLHINLQYVRASFNIVPPHTVHDEVLGEDAPRMEQELPKDLVFGRRQIDVSCTTLRPTRTSIECEVGEARLIHTFRGAGYVMREP